MCAIARALMSGPKLVLLDEPSMGLAPVIVAQVFDLVRRIRSEGYTVLIVEQNVRQVLKVADRAYLLEVGRIKTAARRPSSPPATTSAMRIWGCRAMMDCQLDIFFLEALINGLLLAGLLALLALGLNLDLRRHRRGLDLLRRAGDGRHVRHQLRLQGRACRSCSPRCSASSCVAIAGAVLHFLVIRPVLDTPPINQLLVTGGVLFFLQAAATMAFGIDFKNLGIRLGSVSIADMSFAWSRILAFLVALGGALALWLFLKRTYLGTAIRAISQDRQIMPLMGVDSRRLYLVTSAIGGGLAGLAAALMVLQYDIYPQIGLQFGPLIFMICVLGGLGNMIGGFVAAFIISQFIAVGSSCFHTEWGYAVAFLFFMVAIFIRPQGLFGGKT